MFKDKKIAVVIPTYKASRHVLGVIEGIPKYVDQIILVDDCCPENSGEIVKSKVERADLVVLFNKENLGVGGATLNGFNHAFDVLECHLAIKIDADGQIPPRYIEDVLNKFSQSSIGYVKGSRFLNLSNIGNMPKLRVFLNSILSFVAKFSTGYYKITDPTNGLIGINKDTFDLLDTDVISKRFFFESDLLYHLNINRISVRDIPMQANYADEISNLKFSQEALSFARGNFSNFIKRVFLRHFVANFHLPALYLLVGLPLLIFGSSNGLAKWIYNLSTESAASPGEVILPSLLVLIGSQMLMQFFQLDILDEPQ